MAIEFDLDCSASASDTVAALKKHAAQWREPTIPDTLRRIGVLGVEMRMRSNRFSLRYNTGPSWRWNQANKVPEVQLIASVTAKSDGTCSVQGRCGRKILFSVVAGLSVFGAMFVIGNQPFLASLFFTSAIIFYLIRHRVDQNVERQSDPVARYLVERVEHVIDDLNADRLLTR